MRFYLTVMALAILATSMSVMAANSTAGVPTFILFNSTTKTISTSSGGSLFIRSPSGFNMSLVIPPGTYANLSNTLYSTYNITLSTYRVYNIPVPANISNAIPKSAFLFQINSKIIQSSAFASAFGGPSPVTFTVNHGVNWTSWGYVNETVNGTGFVGGTYSKRNNWIYNTISNSMSDVTLEKAQMHVYYLMPANAVSNAVATTTSMPTTSVPAATTSVAPATIATTIATTTIQPTTSMMSGSTQLVVAIIVVIIIIVIAAAALMTRKKK